MLSADGASRLDFHDDPGFNNEIGPVAPHQLTAELYREWNLLLESKAGLPEYQRQRIRIHCLQKPASQLRVHSIKGTQDRTNGFPVQQFRNSAQLRSLRALRGCCFRIHHSNFPAFTPTPPSFHCTPAQTDAPYSGRIRIAWPPPGARITRSRVAEETGRRVITTGKGLSSQCALAPSA